MKCPKCGYQRLPSDSAPQWQCPSCKVAYVKALQAQGQAPQEAQGQASPQAEAPQPAQAPDQARAAAAKAAATQTREQLEELELSERQALAAQGQKIAIYSIVLNFILRAVEQAHGLPDLVMLVLWLCVGIYSLVGIVKICSGLGRSQNQKILFMVLAFFPIINLIALVYLNVKVTRMLREAGWTVGLFGART